MRTIGSFIRSGAGLAFGVVMFIATLTALIRGAVGISNWWTRRQIVKADATEAEKGLVNKINNVKRKHAKKLRKEMKQRNTTTVDPEPEPATV